MLRRRFAFLDNTSLLDIHINFNDFYYTHLPRQLSDEEFISLLQKADFDIPEDILTKALRDDREATLAFLSYLNRGYAIDNIRNMGGISSAQLKKYVLGDLFSVWQKKIARVLGENSKDINPVEYQQNTLEIKIDEAIIAAQSNDLVTLQKLLPMWG